MSPGPAATSTSSTSAGVAAVPGVVGHGIDLVPIARIQDMLARHGEHFTERCFTLAERGWADAGGRLRGQRYAGRFAAKEAAAKALGTGIAGGIRWTDLEVSPDEHGMPRIVLHGAAAARATRLGAARLHCSITHAGGLAMASVIAVSG